MPLRGPDASLMAQHDKMGSFFGELRDPCGKSKLKKQSQFASQRLECMGRRVDEYMHPTVSLREAKRGGVSKKLKNKANFNLGKIGVSCYLISKYEGILSFLWFFTAKNKANLA